MKFWLSVGVVFFSVAAAALWAAAGFRWVSDIAGQKIRPDGYYEAQITDDGVDVVETAKKQTFWNRCAALAACAAAACQAAQAYLYGGPIMQLPKRPRDPVIVDIATGERSDART